MKPDPDRVRELFIAALRDVGPQGWNSYLEAECGGDGELARQVRDLLDSHLEEDGIMRTEAVAVVDFPLSESTAIEPGARSEGAGTTIGPYKLLQEIGQGGMGVVYMAEQSHPVRRQVALKLIRPGMDSRHILARFDAERQALALMDHPNIAKVLDAGATDSRRPYFVMELIKGVPITQYCDEHRLTPRERLELFVCVCHAVQHAHQKGIIHRDLKPSNVLIGLYDGRPVPKIIDFGVVKAAGPTLTSRTLFTCFGAVVGTPEYMSPEQAQLDNLDIDTRSDVYTLGVLLYELLSGTTPLTRERRAGTSLLEFLRIVREEEPPRPSTRLGTTRKSAAIAADRGTDPKKLKKLIRGDLDWIVMKALEKDRERRYESAAELSRDLERYLEDRPVSARPPSARYRLRKFASRNRAAAVATVLLVLVMILGGGVSAWQAIRATRAELLTRRTASMLAMDKGQLLGESGDANLALLWLSRSLTLAPPGAEELEDAIRHSLAAWSERVDSLQMILQHDFRVDAVAFEPGGRALTAGRDERSQSTKVVRWELATCRSELLLELPGDSVNVSCTFGPDADSFLIGYKDGSVQLIDLATGKPRWTRPSNRGVLATCASFSSDRKSVLVGSEVGENSETETQAGRAERFDVDTGESIGPVLHLKTAVRAVAYHPDGKRFVTSTGTWGNATTPEQIRFWDVDGREYRSPIRVECFAPAVAFSPDGSHLATGHWDHKARLWDLSHTRPPTIVEHDAPVNEVAFSPDGRRVLTGSFDGSVRLWDLDGHPVGSPLWQGHQVWAIAFDRDGRSILVGNRSGASRLWSLAPGDRMELHAPFDARGLPLAVSWNGQTIMTSDPQHVVVIRDTASGQVVGGPLVHDSPVLIGGTSMVAGQRQACSTDRHRALTVDERNVARLWDAGRGTLVARLDASEYESGPATFFAAAFSPDDRYVVTGNYGNTAYVWAAIDGRLVRKLMPEVEVGPVFKVAFSPDGKTLMTAGADRTVRFWDVETGRQLGEPLQHNTVVFAMALSPKGERVLTGDLEGVVHLWDVATRTHLLRLAGHRGGISDVAFSQDGRFALTGSFDRTARLWDLGSGQPIGPPFRHDDFVIRVGFGPEDLSIQTVVADQSTRSWPTYSAMKGPADEIERRIQAATGRELEPDGGVRFLELREWRVRHEAEIN